MEGKELAEQAQRVAEAPDDGSGMQLWVAVIGGVAAVLVATLPVWLKLRRRRKGARRPRS